VRYVGVRELKEQTSRILREVREQGTEFLITYHGQVIARLVPIQSSEEQRAQVAQVWDELDRLAEELRARWPKGISAVEAISEQRREL